MLPDLQIRLGLGQQWNQFDREGNVKTVGNPHKGIVDRERCVSRGDMEPPGGFGSCLAELVLVGNGLFGTKD